MKTSFMKPYLKSFLMGLTFASTTFAQSSNAAFIQRFEAASMKASTGSPVGKFWGMWQNGTLVAQVNVPTDGIYTVWARAYESSAGNAPAQMAIMVDGTLKQNAINVSATANAPQTYARQIKLTAGSHAIGIAYVNDYYAPPLDRNLFVEFVQLTDADMSACGPNTSGVFASALVTPQRTIFKTSLLGNAMTATAGEGFRDGTAYNFFTNGILQGEFTIPKPGTYTLSVRSYENAAGSESAKMQLLVDGSNVGQPLNVAASKNAPQSYSQEVVLSAGVHAVGVKFLNDYYEAPMDRNLVVEAVSVSTVDPHATLIACGDSATVTLALSDCKMVEELDAPSKTQRHDAKNMTASTGSPFGDSWALWNSGTLTSLFDVPVSGKYILSAQAFQQSGGSMPAQMKFLIDGKQDSSVLVSGTFASPQEYFMEVTLSAGKQILGVAFTNDYYAPPIDRNLFVKYVELTPAMSLAGNGGGIASGAGALTVPAAHVWPPQSQNATVEVTVHPGLSLNALHASEGTVTSAGATASWLVGAIKEQTMTLDYKITNVDTVAKTVGIHSAVTYGEGQREALQIPELTAELASCAIAPGNACTGPACPSTPMVPICQTFSAQTPGAVFNQRVEARSMTATSGGPYGKFWVLWENGSVVSEFEVPVDGVYTIWSRAFSSAAGESTAKMAIVVDGTVKDGAINVSATSARPQMYARQVRLLAGRHSIGVAFVNDFFAPPLDRNLFVEYVQVSIADMSSCLASGSGVFASAMIAPPRTVFTTSLVGSAMTSTYGDGSLVGTSWMFWTNGTLEGDVTVPTAGTYTLSAQAYENAGGTESAKMRFLVDGLENGEAISIAASKNDPQTYSQTVTLSAGIHKVGVKFVNDYYNPPVDRGLVIETVSVSAYDANATTMACGESSTVTMALSDCRLVSEENNCTMGTGNWPPQSPNAAVAVTVNPGLVLGSPKASDGTVSVSGGKASWVVGALNSQTITLDYPISNADSLAKLVPIHTSVTYGDGSMQPLRIPELTAELKVCTNTASSGANGGGASTGSDSSGATSSPKPSPSDSSKIPLVQTITPIDLMFELTINGISMSSASFETLKRGINGLISRLKNEDQASALTMEYQPCTPDSSYRNTKGIDINENNGNFQACTMSGVPFFPVVPISRLTQNRSIVENQISRAWLAFDSRLNSRQYLNNWGVWTTFYSSHFHPYLQNRQAVYVLFAENDRMHPSEVTHSSIAGIRQSIPGVKIVLISLDGVFNLSLLDDKQFLPDLVYSASSPAEFSTIFSDIATKLGR